MTRRGILTLAVLTLLAACGVDGEPVQPTLNAGVGISSSGVTPYGGVGLQTGPLSLFLGF